MLEYLIKRITLAAVTLLLILLTSYVLLRLAPGDPTRSEIFASEGQGSAVNAEKGGLRPNQGMREKLNLDRPLLTGFALWLKPVLTRGDFGESVAVEPGRPVTELILERLPVTLSLNTMAILLTYLLAIPIGVYSAVKSGSYLDQLTAGILFILYSLPVMWVGLLLQSVFCEGGAYPVFPLKGLIPQDADSLTIWEYQWAVIKHCFLPVFCLTYGGLAGLSRYTRSGMLDVIHSDYIRSARAKGLSEITVIWHHAFRNTLITLITLFGGLLPGLVAGSVIVEYIFNLPGMGSLSLLALSSRDYPLQMALFFFTGALTLAGILLADLLYMAADPRIKLDRR